MRSLYGSEQVKTNERAKKLQVKNNDMGKKELGITLRCRKQVDAWTPMRRNLGTSSVGSGKSKVKVGIDGYVASARFQLKEEMYTSFKTTDIVPLDFPTVAPPVKNNMERKS